ncbi:hypothetical protein ABB55_18435 [Prosthecomicrobium hirschii]|uniref:Helix-turn-helix domain-containing protein n=1 Tax=Prosthecodimorpha hirschii TaxID=665126 RepID=A0A0P6W410_9HYPH|nr:hypothetical protein [Prosthecomicrobium hirschii]KPL53943.1 hypothetical protein ABB55_18435 [Prosthecomicrobium hirschii]
MNRRPAIGRIKIHQTYTVEELALVTGCHKGTVRRWIAEGMRTIDDRRPSLVSGFEAKGFLSRRRAARKRPCAIGEFYCFRCREPRKPADGMVDCASVVGTSVNLQALCPACATVMHKRVSSDRLSAIERTCDVRRLGT